MNNKCKYLKQGFGKLKCNKLKKEITWSDCKNCEFKEYKKSEYKPMKKVSKTPIKQRTSKQAKLEKDRFSIIVTDMNRCAECQTPHKRSELNYHEVFYGTGKRQLSIKYGLVIPLCTCCCHNQVECTGIHFDKELCSKWHKIGQKAFMEYYNKSADEFRKIFGRNYLGNDK
jgi:hypothetical protein